MPKRPNPLDQIKAAIRRAQADAVGLEKQAAKRARRLAPPIQTRRLTRAEAAIKGVSYSAHRQVSVKVKRVTKRTKTYSERQAVQRRKRITREKFAASRVERRTLKKSGKRVVEYKGLSKAELMKRLKAAGDKTVFLKFTGGAHIAPARYRGEDISTDQWISAPAGIEASELLDPDNLADFIEESGVSGKPRFGLIVYE